MRTGDRIAVAAVGAVALLGVGTGAWVASGSAVGTAPWAARIYSQQGVVGPEQAPRIQCRNKPVWRAVQVVAPPPVIFAHDQRDGGANDAAIVRYRAFVVDFTTGQTVDTSSYSGFAAAWDNAPAQFTGDPATFRLDPDGRYLVDYRVEWYDPYSTTMVGWVADRAEVYDYFDEYQIGPLGVFDSCTRIRVQPQYAGQRTE